MVQTICARGWEAASSETSGGDLAVQSPEPDIDNIPGEQSMGFPPAGAMIIEYLAPRELAPVEVAAPSPARVIPDPLRRVGDHQVRLGSRQHRGDIGSTGAVAAANPVVAQQPDAARPSDRLIGYFRDAVGIGQTTRSQTAQHIVQPIRLEADQTEIEIGGAERLQQL